MSSNVNALVLGANGKSMIQLGALKASTAGIKTNIVSNPIIMCRFMVFTLL
jgi:hypothetical protein